MSGVNVNCPKLEKLAFFKTQKLSKKKDIIDKISFKVIAEDITGFQML